MHGFAAVLGQMNAVEILQNSINTDRIAHAFLFAGPAGVGKRLTAEIFARAVNCNAEEKPCNVCPSCQKAIHYNHPDIIYMKAAGASFKIDQVRELQKIVYSRVYEGKYKVFIIEDIHKATMQASNSLLKTLEEPPGNTIFILISENPNALPQTILSRCQRINFAPLGNELIIDILVKKGYSRDKASQAAEMSLGSVSKGLELIDNEHFLKVRQQAVSFLQIAAEKDYFKLYKLVEVIDKDKTDLPILLEQMLQLLRDLCIVKLKIEVAPITIPNGINFSSIVLPKAVDLIVWASECAKKQANNKLLLDNLGIRLGRLA